MLDSRFKSLCLISSFIGHEQNIFILEEYNKKSLYPMLMKCYHHLHPLASNGSASTKERVIEDCSLNAFEITISTSEPAKELVNKELLKSLKYQMDLKEIKCLLQWWQKHESMFPTMNFFAYILNIMSSHIKIERKFL
jgi:hypothetical protein